ncbi:hypothetical protein C2U72_08490 [Prosthecomicrobium hirschii]|uniref:Fic family protein n=1 Tax=Prosthecodimorpha hirschii TaxID=665126 RepID=UPI00112C43A1|nr:Fic family protein [Prosthecomicrobium hirschii]TPQ51405.1 hypothetical protein C2U72_08490 [Prosthecomicrobium hirschii]
MYLYELLGNENDPVYQELEIANGNRHYDFLRSIVIAALRVGRPFLSQAIIKALNYHAISCLHTHAGEYRPCQVVVGSYEPPQHYRVQALMDDFVNEINRLWGSVDAVVLATHVLWRINYIHPFINGNGRTARAASYYVLCLSAGQLLKGNVILPELLRLNRDRYCEALRLGDISFQNGALDLSVLHNLMQELLAQQFESAGIEPVADEPADGISSGSP